MKPTKNEFQPFNHCIRDEGSRYANRYTLFRIEPIKINDGTIHDSVQYYGTFGWTASTTVKPEDLHNFRQVSEAVANRIKKYIQQ